MRRIGYQGLLALSVSCLALAVAGAAAAKPVDRYTATGNGMTMEISAPRADIIRVRVGQSALPEDASWAVSPEVRGHTVPLDVSQTADGKTELKTSAVVVDLDEKTLAVTVKDMSGRIIVDDAPGKAVDFDTTGSGGGFRLRKAMPEDEHFYGLGDKTGPLDRRGEAFTNWNTDAFGFGVSTDPIYKSIPFVIGTDESGHGYGLFMDNTWRSFFDMGKSERDAYSFGAEGGGIDYYVMAGPDPKAVVQEYAYLTGTAPLTPEWALGFQQSHWSYMTQTEVKGIADHLRADKLPADVVYMDIDYQDKDRPFTVNTQSFPDLPGLVAGLKAENMHLVLITDLHVADVEDGSYAPFTTGMAADIFVKNADGKNFVGPVWPGPAVSPDFTRPKARDWWGQQYTNFVKMGVAGFWNDMDEPSVFNVRSKTMPLDTLDKIEEPGFAPREATQAEIHNVFGMLNSRATYEGVLKLAPDLRPFVLTRASYAGGQRYAATWTGDNSSSWAHLKLSVSQLTNLGLSGFSYAGDDIGGFAGDQPSPDLLTRWIEVGAFNPIFRDHYQKDKPAQEPWVGGADQEAIRRKYIEERYRLMPYIYALAEENSRTGLPIMRPVFLEFPLSLARGNGERSGDTQDQFMLGGDLLVAPAITGESAAPYTVNLPGKGWYDYWTGAQIADATVTETPQLDRLPVYVRPGSIIPKQPLTQSTAETPVGPLTLAVYPGDDCHGNLYFDDGVSFAYKTGGYLRQTVSCAATATGLTLSFGKREGAYKPWWTGVSVVIHGWSGSAKATLKGKALTTHVDDATGTLTIDLPDQAKASSITIDKVGS